MYAHGDHITGYCDRRVAREYARAAGRARALTATPSRVTQEAVTGAHTQPDRSPSSTRAPKSFGRRDVNRCAKVLGVSVDFETTDWLALAHGPIVDVMITYGVLRGVVRLLDRRGRGTSPHLIVRRQIRGIRKRREIF